MQHEDRDGSAAITAHWEEEPVSKKQRIDPPARSQGERRIVIAKRNLAQKFGNDPSLAVFDVTSKADLSCPERELSPFMPKFASDGGENKPCLQVPCMPPGTVTYTVEGGWQALKVFEKEGIDKKKLQNTKGKDIKRCKSRKRGGVLGHYCCDSPNLLGYVEARKKIYIPLYNQMLDLPQVQPILERLYQVHLEKDMVLLDIDTNEDVEDTSKPLSHASLIKARLHRMYMERPCGNIE